MKILITTLKVVLALYSIAGGVYMMSHYEELASTWAASTLPAVFWVVLALVQILLSIGLLVSLKGSLGSKYARPVAIGLAIIYLAGLVLYQTFIGWTGALWGIIPAGLLSLVAYKSK